MSYRDDLRADLIRDEGYRLVAYKDSVGLWTIGVGHLLGLTPRMTEITARECDALLNADIDAAETLARHYVPAAQLDGEVRYRALVEMAFNLGGRLGEFKKFLAAVNGGDWATAGKEMADSTWATQVGERAVRLRGLIETGQG